MAFASAGRSGADVRSDCRAQIELTGSGGIVIALRSKVEALYGGSIRLQVQEVLNALGVFHARIEIEDSGALPFVIGARIEAAVRRAIPELPADRTWLPSRKECANSPARRDRLRRSRLYLPGNEPKYMLNAGLHRPDGIILDLEDSVAPSEKGAARLLVRNALRTLDFFGAERMARINQGETGLSDIDLIVPENVHVILIPKVEDPEQVTSVEGRIKDRFGVDRSPVFLMPIIESAKGGMNAYRIASASASVVALAIGLEDYTADIGVTRTLEGKESFWLRSQVVNAAKAAGVQAIDTVFSNVADMEGLLTSALESKSLGFEGRGCIHPRQIPIIHQAFRPSEQEIVKARKIVAAFEEATAKGLGVVSLGSKMIDPPVLKQALKVVELSARVA